MKILSFNVNGIRAVVGKTFIEDMQAQAPDVICLQETKATPEQVAAAVAPLSAYQVFANSADRKGYSGTAILTKVAPISGSMTTFSPVFGFSRTTFFSLETVESCMFISISFFLQCPCHTGQNHILLGL